MGISPSFLKDSEDFAANVAKAQAQLDAFIGRIRPAMEKQMRQFEAEHAKAAALLEPYMRSIAAIQPPANLPILSPAAMHRLTRRQHDEPPPARSVVRREVKRPIGFTAARP